MNSTSPFKKPTSLQGRVYTVVPSNEMKVVMGYEMTAAVDLKLEEDESPLQEGDKKVISEHLENSIQELIDKVQKNSEISQKAKDSVAEMLKTKYVVCQSEI